MATPLVHLLDLAGAGADGPFEPRRAAAGAVVDTTLDNHICQVLHSSE